VGLLWLLGCQFTGDAVTDLLRVPLPGPVAGMLILFLALQWHGPRGNHGVFVAGDVLLRHLQLLFVPAGVGVVVYLREIADNAWPLLAAMVVSWALGLATVGWSTTLLTRRGPGR
jgi:putative effector of murein hydrolase LrgA (UPF0299 family)